MNPVANSPHKVVYPCGQCYLCYQDYRHLLEHLYWKHGTVSILCNKCNLKRWDFAEHHCHVLPIYETYSDEEMDVDVDSKESPYCLCGKNVDSPMLGCDGPKCDLQWFHFECVGITTPPEGDWMCPDCARDAQIKLSAKTTSTKEMERCSRHRTGKIKMRAEE